MRLIQGFHIEYSELKIFRTASRELLTRIGNWESGVFLGKRDGVCRDEKDKHRWKGRKVVLSLSFGEGRGGKLEAGKLERTDTDVRVAAVFEVTTNTNERDPRLCSAVMSRLMMARCRLATGSRDTTRHLLCWDGQGG